MTTQASTPENLSLVAEAGTVPRFKHDCECCHFLGRYAAANNREADLYVHASGRMPTVIARYSSDGPDYASGLSASFSQIPELTEARLRAQRLGLLDYDVFQALFYAQPGTESFEELRKALPFTLEYQAVLTFEQGDVVRSQGLVSHLVDVAHARRREYDATASRTGAVLDVDSRMARVVNAYRGIGDFRSFELAAQVTAFEWGTPLAKPEPHPAA